MSEQRLYNFSAGPSALPLPALRKAQEELLCLPGVGASVMEISHRSKTFEAILDAAEANVRSLLNVPQNYHILFLQGGGMLQFSMLPMNLLGGKSADYIVSGAWSQKAASEAKYVGNSNIVWDGKEIAYNRKPTASELKLDPNAAYLYICSNETIEGIQYQELPDAGAVPIVCDSSSDFLSKPVDITKYGVFFACAQKNAGPAGVTIVIIRDDLLERSPETLPSAVHYKRAAEQKSMLNTPPCFAIYMVKLVTEWLIHEMGGLKNINEFHKEKAALLYAAIDDSNGFYTGHAQKEYRSLMNVPFKLSSKELDKKFEIEAEAAGLIMLAGHRSIGGLRASIYNAMPRAGVVALCEFMSDFAKKNG